MISPGSSLEAEGSEPLFRRLRSCRVANLPNAFWSSAVISFSPSLKVSLPIFPVENINGAAVHCAILSV
jgi:hypothetical protein